MSQSKKSKDATRPAEVPEREAAHEDELLHVPKGHSRLRFYLTVALVIFVLIIFVVPEALMNTADRSAPGERVYMRWQGMDQTEHRLSRADFMTEKLRFAYLNDQMVQNLGLAHSRVQQDEEAARLILMDHLAREWGIEITDRELANALRAFFGPDLLHYDGYVRSVRGLSKASFENVLRRALRISRFETLLAAGVAVPDPDELVERWQERHLEFAFDYVAAQTADFIDEARELLPSDEELQAWLMARSEVERSRFFQPERYTLEVAYLPLEEAELELDALLAAYPRPEDDDPLQVARDYYNRFTHVRFQRPPEDSPAAPDDLAGPQPVEDPFALDEPDYYSFDEVEDTALIEAPAYYAIADWLSDLRRRTSAADEAADLMEEALALGLAYERVDTPYTRDQLQREVERPWAGRFAVGAHQNVQPGQLVPRVVVEESAIVVTRILERFPRSLPPFEEIRDDVAEAWAKANAGGIALRHLEDLRARLLEDEEEPTVSRERFSALAEEATFEVSRRDYRERFAPEDPAAEPGPIEAYLRVSSAPFAAEEGAVVPPGLNRAGTHAFLVRMAGTRDPDPARMTPDDYTNLRTQLEQQRVVSFMESTYRSMDFLAERHGLWIQTFEETAAR